LKKVELELQKKVLFVSFFFALKAELQLLKFEFFQVKKTDKFAIKWQNFTQVGLQIKFSFRIRL